MKSYSIQQTRDINHALANHPKYKYFREHDLFGVMSTLVESKQPLLPKGFQICLAYMCCRIAEPHYANIHRTLHSFFWTERMEACKKLGYDKQTVIPSHLNALLNDTISDLIQRIPQLTLDALQITKDSLYHVFWEQHPRGWSCKLPHSMNSCTSSDFLPNGGFTLRENGIQYALEHSSFPKQATSLLLTHSGELLDGWMADHIFSSIAPDSLTPSETLKKTLILTGKHLEQTQQHKLIEAYHKKSTLLLSQVGTLEPHEWLQQTLPFWRACAQVSLLSPQAVAAVFEQKNLLSPQAHATLAHQTELFLNYHDSQQSPQSTRQNDSEHASRPLHRPRVF